MNNNNNNFVPNAAQLILNRRRRRAPLRAGDQVVVRDGAPGGLMPHMHIPGRRGECIGRFRKRGKCFAVIHFPNGDTISKRLNRLQKIVTTQMPLLTVIATGNRVQMRNNPSVKGFVIGPAADPINCVQVVFFDGGPATDVRRDLLRVIQENMFFPLDN